MPKPTPEFFPSQSDREDHEAYKRHPDSHRYPAAKLGEIARDLAIELKEQFAETIRIKLENTLGINRHQVKKVIERAQDMLLVEVYDELETVQKRLQDEGYNQAADQVHNDEILLVIRLPEPMEPPPDKVSPSPPGSIEWPEVYNASWPVLWEVRDTFSETHNVQIERINPIGVHKAFAYYYLWLIYPADRPPLELDTDPPE